MSKFNCPFSFLEEDTHKIAGNLVLDEPLPYQTISGGSGFYRPGTMKLSNCEKLDLVLYHNPATVTFIYLHENQLDPSLIRLIGIRPEEVLPDQKFILPGQLCMGAHRVEVIGEAILDMFSSPDLQGIIQAHSQYNLAVFPIAREGLKYQVAEALYKNNDYYCDEIVLDAHHVFDRSVPVYNRKVEMTLFKDNDLDQHRRENITVAFIADSIASGVVMTEVIKKVKERFDHLKQVEVIAPFATIRGLSRIAESACSNGVQVRVHVFETLLNALPPDFYYSAHIPDANFHIRPDLEQAYRDWWGQDQAGHWIANTACAGYGWSEVFFSPRKQIEMINAELLNRHQLTIADVVRRNLLRSNK